MIQLQDTEEKEDDGTNAMNHFRIMNGMNPTLNSQTTVRHSRMKDLDYGRPVVEGGRNMTTALRIQIAGSQGLPFRHT